MSMRYRLSEEDRARYGGPEWLDIDDVVRWTTEVDYDQLVAAEVQVTELLDDPNKGLTWAVAHFLVEDWQSTLIPMQRIRIWLCLVAAGVDIQLADCKPNPLAGDIERPKPPKKDGDADPPPSGEDSSPDTEASSSPESQTSTDGSIPGSPSTSV